MCVVTLPGPSLQGALRDGEEGSEGKWGSPHQAALLVTQGYIAPVRQEDSVILPQATKS